MVGSCHDSMVNAEAASCSFRSQAANVNNTQGVNDGEDARGSVGGASLPAVGGQNAVSILLDLSS